MCLLVIGTTVASPVARDPSRAQAVLRHPAVGVLLVYLVGVALRVNYTLNLHPPEAFVYSDMYLYVDTRAQLARARTPRSALGRDAPAGVPCAARRS